MLTEHKTRWLLSMKNVLMVTEKRVILTVCSNIKSKQLRRFNGMKKKSYKKITISTKRRGRHQKSLVSCRY